MVSFPVICCVCFVTHVFVFVCVSLSVYPGHVSFYVLFFLSVYLSVVLSICLTVCRALYLSDCLSCCLFVWLSVVLTLCLTVYRAVYLSHCLSCCLSVSLSVVQSVWLSRWLAGWLSVSVRSSVCLWGFDLNKICWPACKALIWTKYVDHCTWRYKHGWLGLQNNQETDQQQSKALWLVLSLDNELRNARRQSQAENVTDG